MKNQVNRALISVLSITVWMVFFNACKPRPFLLSPSTKTVETCATHNKDKTACNDATDKDGKKCKYDDIAIVCAPEKVMPPLACKDRDQAHCEASKDCTYDPAKNPKCQDAAAPVKGKCEAIQDAQACKNDTACTWDTSLNKCKTGPGRSSAKTIIEFKLAKVAQADYGIGDDKEIKDVIASRDGNNLYVIGTANKTLRNLDVTANTSTEIDFEKLPQADKPGVKKLNWAAAKVSFAIPLEDGLFAWVADKGAMHVIKNSARAWRLGYHKIPNHNATGLGEHEHSNGVDRFLVMSVNGPGPGTLLMLNKVNFEGKKAKYPEDWANDFAEEIKTSGIETAITKSYKQFLAHDKGMLMLETSGASVDYAKDHNILSGFKAAIIDSNMPDSGGKLNYITDAAWEHRGYNNKALKLAKMDKYIVAIFPRPRADTGGVALFDSSTNADPNVAANWKWAHKDLDCTNIIVIKHNPVASVNDHRAIITTKDGFAVLEDDQLAEFAGEKVVKHANSTTAAVDTYQNASGGAASGSTPLPQQKPNTVYLGAGEVKNGDVYLGIKGNGVNDGGLWRLNLLTKTIQAP